MLPPSCRPRSRVGNIARNSSFHAEQKPKTRLDPAKRPDVHQTCRTHERSIPTGVGTTMSRRNQTSWCSVHPHGRGDNAGFIRAVWARPGPSPRAWGQHVGEPGPVTEPRSIPTGVGTTSGNRAEHSHSTVHPHGRGDNQSGRRGSLLPFRSIPTGVGTTHGDLCKIKVLTVHPHGRGDNWAPESVMNGDTGPSPRAWGQLHEQFVRGVILRSIPTGVGTTSCKLSR